MHTFIVEHLDDELFPWSSCEYKSMMEFVKPNPFIFSNSTFTVPELWNLENNNHVSVTTESVKDLMLEKEKICLLDSESPDLLKPSDSELFTHIMAGGILGNTDEFDFDRTKLLRDIGYPTRNLGKIQMSTDTAIKVAYKIICEGIEFEKLEFVDRPTISCNENESTILNFMFLADENGEPIIAEGVKEILLEDNDFDFDLLE